ncbi:hypothetical protein N657DRAFT_153929 [Parathielavia appendiculata]|uniref:Uncharacterized protein n=1 Tax=Parathielavia appendiculata TaxID=2587402 RepID=A0AAN6TUJ2_9PEZI|nr:hypothetical protein N657DRAFT_153929 [Parathielavia appendiculata]
MATQPIRLVTSCTYACDVSSRLRRVTTKTRSCPQRGCPWPAWRRSTFPSQRTQFFFIRSVFDCRVIPYCSAGDGMARGIRVVNNVNTAKCQLFVIYKTRFESLKHVLDGAPRAQGADNLWTTEQPLVVGFTSSCRRSSVKAFGIYTYLTSSPRPAQGT